MLSDVIDELQGVRVAKACGVTKGAVSIWKRNNRLPGRGSRPDRRGDRYEKRIAKLAGITVAELRERIEEGAHGA